MSFTLDEKDCRFIRSLKLYNHQNRWIIPVCNPGGDYYRQKVIYQTYYVNVYLMGRYYGGPEEGGWWYDSRDRVVHSIPCRNYAIADFIKKTLKGEYPETKHRFSMAPRGNDYEIVIEENKGRVSTERPQYS